MVVKGSPPTRPFRLHVDDAKIEGIIGRVRAYPWNAITATADDRDWRYGPPLSVLKDLCAYWVDGFDWREQERTMAAFPHFLAEVGGLDMHFVHERGAGTAPRPLLIMHGWPYSFHSYTHLIDRLAHPERHGGRVEDAFTVVIPSVPGYDFSAPPKAPMGPRATAALFDELMGETLGYDAYLAHGGDWGCYTANMLGSHHPRRVSGIHVTNLTVREDGAPSMSGEAAPDADADETAFVAREAAIWKKEGAYSRVQSTKPMKLAYGMADSPVGVAAWILEAFHAWSDRRERPFESLFNRDQLLTEIMLYLVTDAFEASCWIYAGQEKEGSVTLPPGAHVEVPVALAAFADPVFPMPPLVMARRSHRVVRYTEMACGGHFPFYEEPDALVDDLRAFSRPISRPAEVSRQYP